MCLDGTTVGSPPALLMANPGCMGLPTVPMDAANATAVAGYMTAGLRRVPKYPPRPAPHLGHSGAGLGRA